MTFSDTSGKTWQGRQIVVESFFPYQRDVVWSKLQTTYSLQFICKPLLYFKPQRGATLKAAWSEGDTAKLRLVGYGFVPLGNHNIHLETIDADNYRIQSRESGQILKIWDHLITLEPTTDGTLYTDLVNIYAGALTGFVAWWATHLYRHRQKRWQLLLEK